MPKDKKKIRTTLIKISFQVKKMSRGYFREEAALSFWGRLLYAHRCAIGH